MRNWLCLLCIISCWGCATKNEVEKHQSVRDNIFNARERVVEIEMEDVLIGGILVLVYWEII